MYFLLIIIFLFFQILDIHDIRCLNEESGLSLHNKVIVDLLDSDLCPSMVSTIVIASVCILCECRIFLIGTI